ncbi:MAG: hypothetical protein KDK30_17220 [Leptospiraceae bacterium]|nr:hypothetical protein [Leptospiraceae bacterium]
MADERLQQYVAYYEARMKKYENNPLYPNAYAAEKALYEAIRDAPDGDAFKQKLFGENLHVKNAIALVRDQETARKRHFEELKEVVRARGPAQILSEIDGFDKIEDLTARLNEINHENSKAISVDLLTDHFAADFTALENLQEAEEADVPSEWKSELKEYIQAEIEEGRRMWREIDLPNAHNWDPNWRMDYDLVWAERHRRKIPVPDEVIQRRIAEHKRYRGND